MVELSEILTAEASNKRVVREFLDAEGPEVVYDIQSCMRGNWMADAKNGTMSRRSRRLRERRLVGDTARTLASWG